MVFLQQGSTGDLGVFREEGRKDLEDFSLCWVLWGRFKEAGWFSD